MACAGTLSRSCGRGIDRFGRSGEGVTVLGYPTALCYQFPGYTNVYTRVSPRSNSLRGGPAEATASMPATADVQVCRVSNPARIRPRFR